MGGNVVPSQFGCGNFGGSKGQGMRHGACKARGHRGTKQEAPGLGVGHLAAKKIYSIIYLFIYLFIYFFIYLFIYLLVLLLFY